MAEESQTRIVPNQPVTPGTRLNGIFEIEQKIAAGGMGEVFRGRNIATSEPVAIKIVLAEFSRDEMIRELFFKEARVLNSLNHPAIVRYQMFTVEPVLGRPYLVMEYIDGCSLDELIHTSRLSVAEVKVLVAKVADALDAAHQAGVVHRDVSPDNFLLVNRNVAQPKIIDFGIARTLQSGTATILGNKFAGRENFASPEQYGLYGGNVTAASDIYSLALVIVAMLRGEALDMSGTQYEQIEKRRRIPDLDDIDPTLRPVLRMMLEPDPADRRLTMADIAGFFAGRSTLPTIEAEPVREEKTPAAVPDPEPASGHEDEPEAATAALTSAPEEPAEEEESPDDIWTLPTDHRSDGNALSRNVQPSGTEDRPSVEDHVTTRVPSRSSAWSEESSKNPAEDLPADASATDDGKDRGGISDPFADSATPVADPAGTGASDTASQIETAALQDRAGDDDKADIPADTTASESIESTPPIRHTAVPDDGRTRIAGIPARNPTPAAMIDPPPVHRMPEAGPDDIGKPVSEPSGIQLSGEPPKDSVTGAVRERQPPPTARRRSKVWGILGGGASLAAAAGAGLYFLGIDGVAGIRLPWAAEPMVVADTKSPEDLLPPMNDQATTVAEGQSTSNTGDRPVKKLDTVVQPAIVEEAKTEPKPDPATEKQAVDNDAVRNETLDKASEQAAQPQGDDTDVPADDLQAARPDVASPKVVPETSDELPEDAIPKEIPGAQTDAAQVSEAESIDPKEARPDDSLGAQPQETLPDATDIARTDTLPNDTVADTEQKAETISAETTEERPAPVDDESATNKVLPQEPATDLAAEPVQQPTTESPDEIADTDADRKTDSAIRNEPVPDDVPAETTTLRPEGIVEQHDATQQPVTETKETATLPEDAPVEKPVDSQKMAESKPAVDESVVAANRAKANMDLDLLPSMESETITETPPEATVTDQKPASDPATETTTDQTTAKAPVDAAAEVKTEQAADPVPSTENQTLSEALPAETKKPETTDLAALEPKTETELGNQLPSRALTPDEWVRTYDGGSCFFAEATQVQDRSVRISSISNDVQTFHTLDAAFARTYAGYQVNIQGRPIDDSQCLVTQLLNSLHKNEKPQIRLRLDSDKIRNGDFLRGEIERNDGRAEPILLLLVDHNGWVYNISNRLRTREDGKTFFSQNIADKRLKEGTFKIVLALSTEEPLPAAANTKPVKSDKLIPLLIDAANRQNLQYAYGFFKITAAE